MYKPTCEPRCAPSVDYFCYPHSVPRVTFLKSERTGCAISRPHPGLLAHYCRFDLPPKHMSPEGPQRTRAGPELPKSSLRTSVQVLKSSEPAPPEPTWLSSLHIATHRLLAHAECHRDAGISLLKIAAMDCSVPQNAKAEALAPQRDEAFGRYQG